MIDEADELPRVMREISEAMTARTSVMTIHPDDGQARPVYHDPDDSLAAHAAECLTREVATCAPLRREEHAWLHCTAGDHVFPILAIPVHSIGGHSRLVIGVVFESLDEDQRARAEQVYLGRRPFAVGYFRLWQLDRTRARRIEALEAALDRTDLGVLLLNREAKLVFANDAAQQLLDAGDGLRRARGGIAGDVMQDSVRLQVAIEDVLSADRDERRHPRASLMMLARRELPALIVSVMPAGTPSTEPGDVAAIVYVLDPAIDAFQLLEPVCKLYHLSPVETKLVCLLATGATLADAAAAMRIKEQTARGCLKQVFVKTDTNRQAELVRIMLTRIVRTNKRFPVEVL